MDCVWNYSDATEFMQRTAKQAMPPLIISVAVTGGGVGKETNPNIPETPEEQAQHTLDAYNAGASAVHIHARTENGDDCTADPARFLDANRRIRAKCPDIIIGNTTAGGLFIPRDQCIKILDANPEMCSINMGPILAGGRLKKRNPPLKGRTKDEEVDWIFPITAADTETIAKKAIENNIKAEMEVHNTSMFFTVNNLIKKNLVEKPYWIQLIFSSTHELPTLPSFLSAVNALPHDSMFSVIGIGAFQLPLLMMSIIMGGHVRVGMEDNIFYRKGEMAKSNAQFVERIVRISRELGREIATPAQAREMIGISATPKKY